MVKHLLKKAQRGFTLIELLVVIAIIGILAAIILVSLNGARAKGRDAQRVANLQSMAQVIQVADTDPAPDFTDCTGGVSTASVAGNNVASCTGVVSGLAQFEDPSSPVAAGTADAASNASVRRSASLVNVSAMPFIRATKASGGKSRSDISSSLPTRATSSNAEAASSRSPHGSAQIIARQREASWINIESGCTPRAR